ncbi:MAG: hypothetical protein ACYTCV_12325, partial [Planctomycetota bacterium]
MVQKELLSGSEIKDVLAQACQDKAPVIASFMVEGKWRILELKVADFSDDAITMTTETPCENLK